MIPSSTEGRFNALRMDGGHHAQPVAGSADDGFWLPSAVAETAHCALPGAGEGHLCLREEPGGSPGSWQEGQGPARL
jgi:hypothetical protein